MSSAVPWQFDANSYQADDVKKALSIWGFVVMHNALSAAEVAQTRAALDKVFASDHLRALPTLCGTELMKTETIWRNIFSENVVEPLRAALGPELCYQHDADVQRNSYGIAGSRPHSGWHMDAGSENKQPYLRAHDYRFVKCGLYLQNFDNGWGGGIRVKPKSHRGLSDRNVVKRYWYFARRVINRIAAMLHLDFDTLHVPTRAGDLCFFDSRLLHSSASPNVANIKEIGYDGKIVPGFWPDVPKEHTKYVIYWDACNIAMSADFIRNSVRRAAAEPSGMQEQPATPAVFTRILSRQFPDDFPQTFVVAAQQRNVTIASLNAQDAAHYKQKLQTIKLLHP